MEEGGGYVAHVYCEVKQCYNDMFTNTSVGGNREAPEHVQYLELTFPSHLCKAHYHVLYDTIQHTKYCRTCGRRLPPGGGRSCPNPKIIQEHLSQNTDFLGEISEQDLVCKTCYKSHLLVLRDSKTTSTDSDIEAILSALRNNAVVDMCSVHDVLDAPINKTLLSVGHMLLEKHAMLLPTIHAQFDKNVELLCEVHGIPRSSESIISQQILSEICGTFQHYVTYAC